MFEWMIIWLNYSDFVINWSNNLSKISLSTQPSMSKVAIGDIIFIAAFSAFLVLLRASPVPRKLDFVNLSKIFNIFFIPEKAFDFNFPNGFPGQGYGFPGGRFGYSGPGFQFNANGFNSYPFNSFSVLANGSIYNSATGDMINGFLIPSTSNSNNINFASNPGADVRVG